MLPHGPHGRLFSPFSLVDMQSRVLQGGFSEKIDAKIRIWERKILRDGKQMRCSRIVIHSNPHCPFCSSAQSLLSPRSSYLLSSTLVSPPLRQTHPFPSYTSSFLFPNFNSPYFSPVQAPPDMQHHHILNDALNRLDSCTLTLRRPHCVEFVM